jgi:hypothetical protein
MPDYSNAEMLIQRPRIIRPPMVVKGRCVRKR